MSHHTTWYYRKDIERLIRSAGHKLDGSLNFISCSECGWQLAKKIAGYLGEEERWCFTHPKYKAELCPECDRAESNDPSFQLKKKDR